MISEERRKILRERTKKCSEVLRKKRKKNNLCVNCGKSLNGTKEYRCLECKQKHNLNSRIRFKIFKEKGICRVCKKPTGENGIKFFCRECGDNQNKIRLDKSKELKQRAIDYLGSKCACCGLKTNILSVYDFHHINPSEKAIEIRPLLFTTWEKIEKEIRKCQLVCSNCHRIIHFEKDNLIK